MVKARDEASIDHTHVLLGSKSVFILVLLIIVLMVVDTSIVKVSTFSGGLASPASSVTIFTAISLVFSVGQYLILSYVKARYRERRTQYESALLNTIFKLVVIIQYA